MNDADAFLDECALIYADGESPARRGVARERLRGTPNMGSGNLFVAAAIGDAEACRAALSGADVNCPGGPRSWPPLLYLA